MMIMIMWMLMVLVDLFLVLLWMCGSLERVSEWVLKLRWGFLQVERVAQLKSQLLECEERSQWMASHAEDVKMQLRQTQLGTHAWGRAGRH